VPPLRLLYNEPVALVEGFVLCPAPLSFGEILQPLSFLLVGSDHIAHRHCADAHRPHHGARLRRQRVIADDAQLLRPEPRAPGPGIRVGGGIVRSIGEPVDDMQIVS